MSHKLVGASVWEQNLYDHLLEHVDKESRLLDDYQRSADESGSAAFRYLVSLIVDEEQRHHQRFKELAASLASEAELRNEEPAIPRLDGWGPAREHVIDLTEQFIEEEKADVHELRRLEKQMREVKDTTLWVLIVKLMEADTEKHLQILNFVKDHARSLKH